MGLGGYLTWTALAREIQKTVSFPIRILPIERHGSFIKLVFSDAFKNNPIISQELSDLSNNSFPVEMNNPKTNYCIKDTPGHALHKCDNHIIETICKAYGIDHPQLKCELFLDDSEEKYADELVSNLNNFIVIEPYSKDNYTPNRAYPLPKWQQVVNKISTSVSVVQVGVEGSPVLDSVIDLTGKTTFREASAVIKRSLMFVGSEGGLVHAATAVDTPAVVVITGYQSSKMVAYPQNINIDISTHGPCGMKIKCADCEKDASMHDPTEISTAILENLKI
tara:strand:- start:13176 stop:14012 length:837 start_codon:yes stop_codon:yes gene_type:complete